MKAGGERVREMEIEIFTTERLAPGRSVRAWNASSHLAAHDFVLKPQGTQPFRGSLRRYASRCYTFAEVAVSSHTAVCRPALSAGGIDRRPYLLVLLNEGNARVLQDGRETLVGVNDAVLVDPSRPLCMDTTAIRANLIDVPAGHLREILPQVDGLTATRIPCQKSSGMVLKAAMDQIFGLPPNSADQVIDHVADAVPHLLAATLSALPEAKQVVPRQVQANHRQRVLEFVRTRLHDRDLRPQMIAQALDLSLRYIHDLFADSPPTLMHRIWNERLERCRDELGMPSLAQRSISEMAYRWGFNHPAHFSRAFAARFGQSPRAFRQGALMKQS